MGQRFDDTRQPNRRRFLGLAGAGLAGLTVAACGNNLGQTSASRGAQSTPRTTSTEGPSVSAMIDSTSTPTMTPAPTPTMPAVTPTPNVRAGQLGARPAVNPPAAEGTSGTHQLGVAQERDALLYVPPGYRPDQSHAMVLLLHGAGGNAEAGLSLLQPLADAANLVLLAVASRQQSWDVIVDDYGPDVELIDRALTETFSRYAVDPQRLAIAGFSDGGSYALSLGLSNGELVTHIIAFSPGFMAPKRTAGNPGIFISHGIHDDVLPIDRCSRQIVPRLERAGYAVRYREFDGPHTVPPEITREALDWFMGSENGSAAAASGTR